MYEALDLKYINKMNWKKETLMTDVMKSDRQRFYSHWDSKHSAGKLTHSPRLCGPPQNLIDGLTGKWTCDK